MKTHKQGLPTIFLTLACAALAWLAVPAAAEVGVFQPDELSENPAGPYEIRAIIDDGDPVGWAWHVYHLTGGGWHVLNPGGEANGDGRPGAVFNPVTGESIVAWARGTGAGFDVVLSWFSGGAWTDPVVLASGATVTEPADPCLAVDPANGSVHLFYWTDDTNPEIVHRKAPADLSSWTNADQVSQPGELAVRPSATFHEGQLRIAYEVHTGQLGGAPRLIVLAAPDGGGYTSEVIGSTDYTSPNRPQVPSPGDTLWVEWIDAEGTVTWTRRIGTGPWDPIDLEPFTSPEERDYQVPGRIRARALGG